MQNKPLICVCHKNIKNSSSGVNIIKLFCGKLILNFRDERTSLKRFINWSIVSFGICCYQKTTMSEIAIRELMNGTGWDRMGQELRLAGWDLKKSHWNSVLDWKGRDWMVTRFLKIPSGSNKWDRNRLKSNLAPAYQRLQHLSNICEAAQMEPLTVHSKGRLPTSSTNNSGWSSWCRQAY